MKLFKKTIHLVFLLAAVSLVTFIISMQLHPKETADFVGYRMYSVLTNSMEPRIPTNSLVFTKVVDKNEDLVLKKGDIITFNANRFGEEILITHHFNKMEQNDKGEWCYRTNPESTEELDMYETKREDIIGTYVFHIPYVGKLVLFLQSKFGFLMYAELFVVWCVNKLIKARWEEKDKGKEKKEDIESTPEVKEEVEKENVQEEQTVDTCTVVRSSMQKEISGLCICVGQDEYVIEIVLNNTSTTSIRNILLDIYIYDEQHMVRKSYKVQASKDEWIQPGQKHLLKIKFSSSFKLSTFESFGRSYEMKKDDSL